MGNRYVDFDHLCLQSIREDAHWENARGCAFEMHYNLAIVVAFFEVDVRTLTHI